MVVNSIGSTYDLWLRHYGRLVMHQDDLFSALDGIGKSLHICSSGGIINKICDAGAIVNAC